MNQRKAWLGIGAVLLLLAVVIYWSSKEEPEVYPPYTSESPALNGLRGFYTLLEEQGQGAARWTAAPGQLPGSSTSRTLLMAEPLKTVSGEEMQRYREWMEAGHTIWLMKQHPAGYFDVGVEYPESRQGSSRITDADGNQYDAEVRTSYRLRTEEADQVLLKDELGAIAVERSYGEGRLIVSLTPSWLTNDQILDKDHFTLVSKLMDTADSSGGLWFDEYIHTRAGFADKAGVYPSWILFFTIQMAVLTILSLWWKGKRFGPYFTPREAVVRFGDERLQAVASWYKKGAFYRESLEIQESYVRQLLQERYGVPVHLSWEETRESLDGRVDADVMERWTTMSRRIEPLEHQSHVDKKSYLEWSGVLEEMRKEVQDR
ncbi:DUF4350 domain-containing protein [Halobacillus litoralis]|uniref:DUF4350 domain-containing protein n=1 Tax=Halobacillus litoralis TaxID=45668 RepID=UPI00136DA306|nr:DUF4350 domain-containing protein [Halobacillus litoralis]MYL36809.1 DUF4350 domain-containing protein [Halobacillus litoralis]